MTVLETIARAVGITTDPHKAERAALPTLADLSAAEEKQHEASRTLEAKLSAIKRGESWPGSADVARAAFDLAARRVQAIKDGLNRRKDLAPFELTEKRRRLKRNLVANCTKRNQLQNELVEHARAHAKLVDAVNSAQAGLSIAKSGNGRKVDQFSVSDAEGVLRRAQRAVAESTADREFLVEQIDELAQAILEGEQAVAAVDADILTI